MTDERTGIEDQLAEDALVALAGRECEYGGGQIDPRTGQCEEESHAHCLFCSEPGCSHEIASWSDDNGYSGPAVPLPPRWLGPVTEWSDERKQTAFGDLFGIAGTYAEFDFEGSGNDLITFEIVDWLAGQLTVPTNSASWTGQGMASGTGTVVYARDPSLATAELATVLDRLRQGFERLAVSESGIEDLNAEVALAILADLGCPICGQPVSGTRPWFCSICGTAVCLTCGELSNAEGCGHLLPTEGRPGWDHKTCVSCGEALHGWRCARCLSVHCPFCGVRSWAWRGSSFLLGETQCAHLIASWDGSSGEWSETPDIGLDELDALAVAEHDDAEIVAAFGDLADLARTVEEEQANGGGTELLLALIKSAKVPPFVDVFWDNENGMWSDTGTDFFAANPAATTAMLAELVERLVQGQTQLEDAQDGKHRD